MSYEKLCEELYNNRLAEKEAKELRRQQFRQSVIDRQLQERESKHHAKGDTSKKMEAEECFEMPEVLPDNIDKLKWLIFQNIEIIQKDTSKAKEAKENIKRIKAHIQSISD